MTCILLHNFLRRSNTSRNFYTPNGTADSYVNGELLRGGSWRSTDRGTGITPLKGVPRRSTENALETRVLIRRKKKTCTLDRCSGQTDRAANVVVGAPSLRQVPFDVADTARQARKRAGRRSNTYHQCANARSTHWGKWLGQRACQRVGLCVVPA
ncbi:unnamed protein product [Arctia plantaginis]|uniref:Uncharacterized protein n=1 Tax=Arctia plantaginis TaxID=874455 RepID=A0A8S0ZHQ2_ARCPL|nr:unnamed protein product [Arctia plantaginis]